MKTSEAVAALAGAKILLVGDVMLDTTIHGDAYRISAEAPVPVFKVDYASTALGGAGNVLANLVAMGADVRFAAMIGSDPNGKEIIGLVKGAMLGIQDQDPYRIFIKHNGVSTAKTRLVSQGQQVCRMDVEDTHGLDSNTHLAMLKWLRPHYLWADAIVISDYDKGFMTNPLIRLLTNSGRPCIVNTKRAFDLYSDATVIITNQLEAQIGLEVPTPAPEDLVRACYRFMSDRVKLGGIIVTLGEDGLVSIDGMQHTLTRAHKIEVRDVTGAGDSVTAAVAVAMARGASITDAAALGNRAGAVAVSRHGTAQVTLDDLMAHMRDGDARKVAFHIEDAAQAARHWHGQGKRVGLVSGVFDLIHPGHVDILRAARARCDKLVVALNTDHSAMCLKGGYSAPKQNVYERQSILAAMSDVDLVIRFGEPTPLDVAKAIRPDVLVRGDDHQEADEVSEWVVNEGGDFHVIKRTKGLSSTEAAAA